MKRNPLLNHFVVRNWLGLLALLAVHFLADMYAMDQRVGFSKLSPYMYLWMLYGWLVFHNRVLFERLFLQGKKVIYFGCLLLLMALGSFNMNFILKTQFATTHSLPHLVNFWVYTVTGLGVYVTYRYIGMQGQNERQPVEETKTTPDVTDTFSCMVDGVRQVITYPDIRYIESLENYVKVFTKSKTYITRMTLKEAEERLPKRLFVRISRSSIVNTAHVDTIESDTVRIGTKELRIGKVYKRYVAGQLAGE
ncbi:LytR/AlgR family response regulator transcription factor [Spirosoma agri]|uniref:LytTR family transcriptional regulator n=1 Tax=Spirosoma agri TaxID=1987381 RepID=A0A6M0IPV6_9BACT|nr:LytTR family DNA-binding domain-containing protein [Spirosoma agri]NEU69947.1 LytTR family transcriptional regulator [Spirosoma agri]